jgi:sugar phosphate isomerase/epimerase
MNSSLTRRDFLDCTGRLCAGAAVASLLARSAIASAPPRLAVTVRDAMLRATGQADGWAALKRIGAEGFEAVVSDDFSLPNLAHGRQKYSVADDAGIRRLKADAAAAGQKITALCMANRFDERPDTEVELCTKVARAAQALGARAIRIDLAPHKLARDEFLALSIKTLGRLLAATESTGVAFAIENHGTTTNDPAFLRPLFAGVGSPRLGLTLDTGNFYWFGHPLSKVYELYETFAPRVFHTHCKSIRYPAEDRQRQRPVGWKYGQYTCPIYEGDIDFRRVVAILKAAGYANDLCVEDESLGKATPGTAASILAKEIEMLKGLR